MNFQNLQYFYGKVHLQLHTYYAVCTEVGGNKQSCVPLNVNDTQLVFHQWNSMQHWLMEVGISKKTQIKISMTHTSLNISLVVFKLLVIRIFCIRANFLLNKFNSKY